MKDEKTTCSTSANTVPPVTLDTLREVAEQMQAEQVAIVRGLCESVPVISDELGLMVHPDGYAVVVGKRLYRLLKANTPTPTKGE